MLYDFTSKVSWWVNDLTLSFNIPILKHVVLEGKALYSYPLDVDTDSCLHHALLQPGTVAPGKSNSLPPTPNEPPLIPVSKQEIL